MQSLRQLQESSEVTFTLIHTQEDDTDAERAIYEAELQSLGARENRLREAYMAGVDSLEDYRVNKGILDNRRQELEDLLTGLLRDTPDPAAYKQQFLLSVSSVIDILESDADYCTKGEALRGIVQKIVFFKETQTLEFHYYLSV